ncbi:MAG: hypothetical protein U0736_11750 [Gemmataceae bacterium]
MAVNRNATGSDSGDDFSRNPLLSHDSRYMVFESVAANLVSGQVDTNGDLDVFQHDHHRPEGAGQPAPPEAPTRAGATSMSPSLSADGRMIAFASISTDLVTGVTDLNDTLDIFVYDTVSGQVTLVNAAAKEFAAHRQRHVRDAATEQQRPGGGVHQ